MQWNATKACSKHKLQYRVCCITIIMRFMPRDAGSCASHMQGCNRWCIHSAQASTRGVHLHTLGDRDCGPGLVLNEAIGPVAELWCEGEASVVVAVGHQDSIGVGNVQGVAVVQHGTTSTPVDGSVVGVHDSAWATAEVDNSPVTLAAHGEGPLGAKDGCGVACDSHQVTGDLGTCIQVDLVSGHSSPAGNDSGRGVGGVLELGEGRGTEGSAVLVTPVQQAPAARRETHESTLG